MLYFISDLHLESCKYPIEDIGFLIIKNAKELPLFCKRRILFIAGDLFPVAQLEKFKSVIKELELYYDEIFWIIGNSDLENKSYSKKKILCWRELVKEGFKRFKILDCEVSQIDDVSVVAAVKPRQLMPLLKDKNGLMDNLILITHYPPNESDLNIVRDLSISVFWISGHIHTAIDAVHCGVHLLRNPYPLK